ncbi:MAG: DUF2971 domain-containing protein, partial [Nitrosopumilaceae archaeon]|nr:DUF2971 domain-containing protein [Nitrosopumilaceae archaeon]NIX62543.1 DUF2971 domain-containing protein [Nitrosopumilaceae archaeon]
KAELEKQTNRLREEIRRILNEEIGVLSLSAKNDNILMWAHYADYHKGFCIEFKRSQANALGATKPVHYVKEYPFLSYFDDLPGNIVKKMILTKAEDWSYEAEWRGLNTIDTEVYYTDDMITGIIFGFRMPEDHNNEICQILKDK